MALPCINNADSPRRKCLETLDSFGRFGDLQRVDSSIFDRIQHQMNCIETYLDILAVVSGMASYFYRSNWQVSRTQEK